MGFQQGSSAAGKLDHQLQQMPGCSDVTVLYSYGCGEDLEDTSIGFNMDSVTGCFLLCISEGI